MICERCSGLMTMDRYINAESQELGWMELWRCLACGNVVDPQIQVNRLLQRALRERGARIPSQRAWNRHMVRRMRSDASRDVVQAEPRSD
jgi:hypothetical protein